MNHRRQRQRVYSPPHLATLAPPQQIFSTISRDSSPSSLYIDFGLFLLVFSSRERRETRRCLRHLTAAPQTSRLSSSSTPRLVKVADIRLLWGKCLDRRINLLNINTFLHLSRIKGGEPLTSSNLLFWCSGSPPALPEQRLA